MAAKEELRDFLRSRRARLSPADVGLNADRGPRRVPGLRREELAELAGLSVDYYTRLEQGRDINVSEGVLRAVANALQLREDERAHLHNLARPTRTRRRPTAAPPQRVRPGVRTLLDALPTPGFVLGRRLDILATNPMAPRAAVRLRRPPATRPQPRPVGLPGPSGSGALPGLGGGRPRKRRDITHARRPLPPTTPSSRG